MPSILSLAALCMAACSEDDDFLPDGGMDATSGDVQEYTFTVGIDRSMVGDDGSVSTRATATTDDAPTRCLMQAFYNGTGGEIYTGEGNEDGGYTFTVKLAAGRTYTFCFWADNGTQDVTSLNAVPYTIGTIAFAGNVTSTPENLVTNGITLTHAVTKVTLKTSKAVTIAEGAEATIATTCASSYNVQTGAAATSGTQTYNQSTISGSLAAGAEAASCYLIPTTSQQNVTISCHFLSQTIDAVPLAVNTHVTLQGDLSEDNVNWQVTSDYYKGIFYNALFKKDGTPKGYREGTYYNYYAPSETITKLVVEVLKSSIPSFFY